MKLLVLLAFFFGQQSIFSCNIHGTNSGICTNKYLPSTYGGDSLNLEAIQKAKAEWQKDMPYCGKWIASYYSPCVPSKPNQEWISPDANFEFGRLLEDQSNIQAKDKWVQETVDSTIESRIESEREKGSNHYHFYQNKDCQEAFARYSCWLNFPRCDSLQESLPLCQSACENLFRVCKFDAELWRCEADLVHGDDEYDMRSLFPGQPFKKNEFLPKSDGEPKPICTPSIKSHAASRGIRIFVLVSSIVVHTAYWF